MENAYDATLMGKKRDDKDVFAQGKRENE